MSIDSTEVSPEGKTLQNRRPLSSEDKATVPAAAKGVVKTVELTGKAAIGTVKLTKNILSTPVRLIGRNLWGSKVPAVLAGVAITAGSAGGGADAFKEKTGAAFQDPVKTVRLAGAATADALTEAVDKAISKTKLTSGNLLSVKIDRLDKDEKLSSDEFFELAFGKLNETDKEVAYAKLLEANKEIDTYHGDEVVKQSYKYEPMVRFFADRYGIPFEFLMGAVIAESKGDPSAASDKNAVGLLQPIRDVAVRWGLRVDDKVDQRKDPFLNLMAGSAEIADNMGKEGTLAGALEAHYMGLKGYTDFKRDYLARHFSIELGDIVAESTAVADENVRLNRLYTIQKGITPLLVFKDPEIEKQIKEGDWRQPDMYIPYVYVAYLNYERRKDLLGLIDVYPTDEGEKQFDHLRPDLINTP